MRSLLLLPALALLAAPAFAGTVQVGVNGLVCAFCVSGIEAAFKKEPGVEATQVDLDAKRVSITTTGDGISDERIRAVITDTGYNVTSITREE